jgi:hypothetical protein
MSSDPAHMIVGNDSKPITTETDHTQWVVGIVSAAVVVLLGWFAASDRRHVEESLILHAASISATSQTVAVHDWRIAEQEQRARRIEEKLDAILARVQRR